MTFYINLNFARFTERTHLFCLLSSALHHPHCQFIGGALLLKSGMLLALAGSDTSICLLASRFLGGIIHGLVYVVIIVHASENATKDFREFLLIVVGVVMNYSILISVLAFFHTEGLFNTGILNGIGLFAFGVCAMVIAAKHSTETVPFILQNNGSEMDALQTVSKLKKKPIAAQSVHHDFLTMKNLVHDEMDHYGVPTFRKILLPENRKSLIFCFYGRLCSVLSFNLPLIVMVMLFLRGWVDESMELHGVVRNHGPANKSTTIAEYAVTIQPYTVGDENRASTAGVRTRREIAKHPGDSQAPEKLPEHIVASNQPTANNSTMNRNIEGEKADGKSHVDEATQQHSVKDERDKSETTPPNTNKLDENNEGKEAEEKQKTMREKSSDKNGPDGSISSDKVESERSEGDGKGKKNAEAKESDAKDERDRKPHDNVGDSFEEGSGSQKNNQENTNESEKEQEVERTFFAHLLIFLHSRELTLVLLAWFLFGTITVAILYMFSLRRYIYHIACVLAATLALTGLAHSFDYLSAILHLCLIIYFNYVTIPIDVFGHCMLAEAFPITLKAYSVAGIAALEHLVHVIVIGLYMTEWFHDSIILLMCIVSFVAHEIARNLPQQTNLSLGEAREQYQNIDLLLFNEPITSNYQQQEFI